MRKQFLFVAFMVIKLMRPMLSAAHPFKKSMPNFDTFTQASTPAMTAMGFMLAASFTSSVFISLLLIQRLLK